MENQSSVRRRRFTPQERNNLLKSYQQSGLTQRAFASQAGISLSCLQRWLILSKRGQLPPSPAQLLEVKPPPPAASGRTSAGYTLEFPEGIVLKIPRGFAPEEVLQLARLFQTPTL